MSRDLRFSSTPLAEEFDVGDDSDMPGFDQPYTSDDIEAIVSSADATVEERCEVLRRMLNDLENRQDMDRTQEFAPLIDEVRAALAALSEPADGIGPPGAFAYDPEERALAPDEILEREEEEEARRQAEGD
jgi:cytochrome c556